MCSLVIQMTHLIQKKETKRERWHAKERDWQYYWLEKIVQVPSVVTKFRKRAVIMLKIDMSWQPVLTLKVRLDAAAS